MNMEVSNGNARYSLRYKVLGQLEESILNGEYQPGDYLVETKLSRQFGVSRTPIREAIRQLEREGLVKIVTNKGAMVLGVTDEDIEDIYNIRMEIEKLAVRWAIQKITPDEIEKLKEQVELAEFYINKKHCTRLQDLDTEFHRIIYDACKSRPLKHMLSDFHRYVQRARKTSLQTPGLAKEALKEHKEILETIIEENVDKAEALICKHIRNAKENLLKNHILLKTEEKDSIENSNNYNES